MIVFLATVCIATIVLLRSGASTAVHSTPRLDLDWSSALKSSGSSLQLSTIAPFDWDRVYVFGPYSTAKEIQEAIGLKWWDSRISIEIMDDVNLLVFVKDQQVVAWSEVSRHIEFLPTTRAVERQGLARDRAVFDVAPTPDGRIELHVVSSATQPALP